MRNKNLTLKEAIESGKKFKRPMWRTYAKAYRDSNGSKVLFDAGNPIIPYIDDLIATDYELKEEPKKKKTITYYKYFYVYEDKLELYTSGYTQMSWEQVSGHVGRILVETETKTIEVDCE